MAYKLSPAERSLQARLLREEREKRNAASRQKTTSGAKKNGWAVAGATAADLGGNVLIGLGKGLEGIYDLGAGLVGAVGGLFSDEFENDVKQHVARDFTGELYGNALQEATEASILNDSKVGQIVEGVAQGLGQLLPAVAVSMIPGVGTAAASKLALTTTIASAAGTSTESAFNDGADYGKGLAYGATMGAVEGVTEKLVGGPLSKVTGAGILDDALGGVAKTGAARVAKEAAGEGVEEMASEVLGQGAKSIYKGKDAFKEYSESDFWQGVGEAGIIGAGTSLVYGETVGRALKTSGVYADANSVNEHIAKLEKQRSKPGLSQAQRVQIERNIKADTEQLANRLAKLSPEKRKKVFAKMPDLQLAFDENGQVRAENLAALDAKIAAAEDTTYDIRYRSATASAERISTALAGGSDDTHEMRAYSGEITETQEKNLAGVRELTGAVSERSGGVVGDFVVAEKSPKGGAYFDEQSGLIVIGLDSLENGTAKADVARALEDAGWQETVVHEVYHGVENTTAGRALAKLVTDNETLHGLAVSDVLSRGYMKEYFGENADVDTVKQRVDELIAKENAGQELTADEQAALETYKSEVSTFAVQRLLGTKSFVKKLITTDPSTAEKVIGKIRELAVGLKNKKSPDAKKQAELLKKAERLFMRALSEAGGTIDADGKIHIANDEEDDELTGENEENMQVSGEKSDENSGLVQNSAEKEKSPVKGVRWSRAVGTESDADYADYDKPITARDIEVLRSIGRKSINEFTSEEIKKAQKWAHKFYKELGVKSPFFRAWFGDWRAYDKSLLKPVVVTNLDVASVLDNMETGIFSNKDVGWTVSVGSLGKRDTVSHSGREKVSVRMLSEIKKILESAVLLDTEVSSKDSSKKHNETAFMHKLYTPVIYDGKQYIAKVTVEEYGTKSTGRRFYNLRGIKIDLAGGIPDASTSYDTVPDTRSINSISDLFAFVKRYDTEFSPKPANPAFLNEDGTPKVFYHGTDAEWIVYDLSKNKNQMWGEGIYLTPDIERARLYGEHVMPFYVKADADNRTAKRNGVPRDYTMMKNGDLLVYSPEQIKSVTDNIGTFDRKTSDTRYSRKATGEVVTLSKGELAKLHANYAGDKVFSKGAVSEAVKGIDAWKRLPAAVRTELVNALWAGYNGRLHQQGFDLFTEVMWHKIHAEILQESGFDMTEDEIRAMDEQIVNALHAIVDSGKPSIKAKLESATSTEGYRKQADFWRGEHKRAVESHKRLNSLKYELEKLANQKKGLYVSAANYRGDTFKVAIDELARMNWRGGLVSATKIRERFAALAAWYTKDNPLYKSDSGTNALFRQEIADALNSLGNSQNGALTNEDLLAAETVVKYFAHEIESHATYYKDGKRLDAVPEVKKYLQKAQRAREVAIKCGMWSNLMRSRFARLVADPAMLMRQADGYLSGFFTEQYEALRQGAIDAQVLERELSEEFEAFWDEHKAYGKRYNGATVTFGDAEMPLQEAISLYMTMHREHAFAGLAGAGFEIDGKKATENISDGFADEVDRQLAEDWKALPPEELLTLSKKKNAQLERAALRKVVEAKRKALYDQFTAEDRALIEIMERAYEKCRDVKVKIDEIVQGYSNVTGGYYYPIRRTGLAENVDAYTGFEGDRVSNLSMNKETVKNAHKLYIEPAHIVFMRHLKATSLYHGLGVFTDNFNRLYNLNVGTNANNPITVRTELGKSNKFVKEMVTYFKELKQDVEGISKKRSQEKAYNDAVAFIRSSYATFQLGANPKVWVTQLSSLLAATNIIDVDCLTKGLAVSGKDVDEFCRLAWLRNNDGSAAMAQAVSTPQNAVQRAGRNALQKVRDFAMLPIGKVDRLVITRLFGACQVQVEKNGGPKVGTKENKVEAGKLLTRVILETQQNSLATERSVAMRSADELIKGFTMFSADAMKVGARFVDAFGELSVLKTLYKEAKKAGDSAEVKRLEGELARAKKQCVRATVALVGVAFFNAALAYGFKWLYRRDEEETAGTFVADTFGNMLGGIPFVRDIWSLFQDGFEMDHFLISTVNDVLGTAAASFELVRDAASGKEVTQQEALANMRKVLYAAGQISGVPTRNLYNFTTGMINRISPSTGYKVESYFYKQSYSADLEKALAAGDDKMVAAIAGLMIDEKIGIEDEKMRLVLKKLAGEGYSVLPRSVGDSVTLDGEEYILTGKQQKRFRTVYGVAEEAVADMVRLKRFTEADAAVQAKAVQFIYDVYWDLALEDVLGKDLAEKNVLFAEAIDIEKLAIIIAMARSLEADKDKDGKSIAGTKKRKVEKLVASLNLTAAQKYMVMGYLGYTNKNGKAQVEGYISRLKLTNDEKTTLLKYSGYAA